ncbi:MAG: MerR family transcriptional regulator [Dorea sp.]|jgi:DNA-binding transcriptional MerR regulator|nr:MerR family transcriptional regulator [Dorea sp.]
MRTVKEIAELTGISARTLHYYDEIDLFVPTAKSEAGYRLYDDKALEILQQILFFREFDIPLKEIKAVMDDPNLDRNQILKMQRKMLVAKKERMERLIAGIDDILKGDNRMDFTIFSEEEIRAMYDGMVQNMNEEQKQIFVEHYGSMNAFREHYLECAASGQAQKNFAKVVEWYGSKDAAIAVSQNPDVSEVMAAYQKRMGAIQQKVAGKMGTDVNTLEVRELIGEYDFVARQLYQMDDVKKLMLELGEAYKSNKEIREGYDSVYGNGAASYMGEAIAAFYNR